MVASVAVRSVASDEVLGMRVPFARRKVMSVTRVGWCWFGGSGLGVFTHVEEVVEGVVALGLGCLEGAAGKVSHWAAAASWDSADGWAP